MTYKQVLAVVVGILAGLWLFDNFDEGVIRGKRVLITGASTGIGEQMAYHFARMGASVMVTARRVHRLQEVVARCRELGSPGATFGYISADMSNLTMTKTLIMEAVQKMGGLDYLVLNHIYPQKLQFWEGTEEDMDYLNTIIDVNFKAYVHLASHALPELEKSSGRVIVLSSFAGKASPPFSISYAASKFALAGFFNGLRQELTMKGSNISITLCIIGFIGTDNALTAFGKLREGIPLKRLLGSAASPSDTAFDIIRGGANRRRELYSPFFRTFSPLMVNGFFPSAIDYVIRMIYAY